MQNLLIVAKAAKREAGFWKRRETRVSFELSAQTVRGLATLDFLLEESAGSGAGAAAVGHKVSAAGQSDCGKLPLDAGQVTFCD